MEPLSNEEARLRPPALDTQALNDLPLPDDDSGNDNINGNNDSFPFPSTPPPTYGEAGKIKKTPQLIIPIWLHITTSLSESVPV